MNMIRDFGFRPAFRPATQIPPASAAPQTADTRQTRADQAIIGNTRAAAAAQRSPGGARILAAGIALGVACTLAPAILLHGGVARAALITQPVAMASVAMGGTQSSGQSFATTAAPSIAATLGQPAPRPIVPVTLPSPTFPTGVGMHVDTTSKWAEQTPAARTTQSKGAAASQFAGASRSAAASQPAAASLSAAASQSAGASQSAAAANARAVPEKTADDTILTHIGRDTHVVADKTAEAGKAVWRPLKKTGTSIGHFFGKGGHQLQEGWDSKDR